MHATGTGTCRRLFRGVHGRAVHTARRAGRDLAEIGGGAPVAIRVRSMTPSTRLALLATLSLAACRSAQMKVDPALADDRMKVSRTGRWGGGDLVFGEYTAHDIDRSWTHKQTVRIGDHEETRAHQKYWFTMRAGEADAGRVACETVFAGTAHRFGRLRLDDDGTGLGCVVEGPDGRPRGELVLIDGDRPHASGRMIFDDVAVELVAERRAEGARVAAFAPLGYQLQVDGHAIGAVQTINGGAVWIDAGAPAPLREAAAVAAATVLLYDPIEG
jgi:hypothetical protein